MTRRDFPGWAAYRDSAIFVLAGEGWSGATSGPPYAMAGTLLTGFTLGAYQSGLLKRSISKRLKSAWASASAISACTTGRQCWSGYQSAELQEETHAMRVRADLKLC
jgi:hypothetical protein